MDTSGVAQLVFEMQRRFPWRPVLILVSAFLGSLAYHVLADPLHLVSVFDYARGQQASQIRFYASTDSPTGGCNDGFQSNGQMSPYAQLGSITAQAAGQENLRVCGQDSHTNLFSVEHNTRSFGLVQSDTLDEHEEMRRVTEIGPLYAEYVHILYSEQFAARVLGDSTEFSGCAIQRDPCEDPPPAAEQESTTTEERPSDGSLATDGDTQPSGVLPGDPQSTPSGELCSGIDVRRESPLLLTGHVDVERPRVVLPRKLIGRSTELGLLWSGSQSSAASRLLPHLLTSLNIPYHRLPSEESGETFGDAVEQLRRFDACLRAGSDELPCEGPAVVVFVSGAPVSPLAEHNLRATSGVCMMGLDPAVVSEIDGSTTTGYIPLNFGERYVRTNLDGENLYSNLPTIGAYSTLIASSDVTPGQVADFLGWMNAGIESSRSDMSVVFGDPPIDRIELQRSYESRARTRQMLLIQNLLLFLGVVGGSTAFGVVLLTRIVSSLKRHRYYHRLMVIYRRVNPAMPSSSTSASASELVSQCHAISQGIVDLKNLSRAVRTDFESGGLTLAHHQMLLDQLDDVGRIGRTRMYRKLRHRWSEIQRRRSDANRELQASCVETLLKDGSRFLEEDSLRPEDFDKLKEQIRVALQRSQGGSTGGSS